MDDFSSKQSFEEKSWSSITTIKLCTENLISSLPHVPADIIRHFEDETLDLMTEMTLCWPRDQTGLWMTWKWFWWIELDQQVQDMRNMSKKLPKVRKSMLLMEFSWLNRMRHLKWNATKEILISDGGMKRPTLTEEKLSVRVGYCW